MVELAIFLAARETELCCQVELHCRTVFRGQILTNNAFRHTTDTVSRTTYERANGQYLFLLLNRVATVLPQCRKVA